MSDTGVRRAFRGVYDMWWKQGFEEMWDEIGRIPGHRAGAEEEERLSRGSIERPSEKFRPSSTIIRDLLSGERFAVEILTFFGEDILFLSLLSFLSPLLG